MVEGTILVSPAVSGVSRLRPGPLPGKGWGVVKVLPAITWNPQPLRTEEPSG